MSDYPEIQGYKILKELGKGGMARVYLAIEEKLEREVALKILLKSLTEEKNLTTRFLKEAKTAAGLRHTNIVPVFDVGREGEYYYFTMEHFEENLKNKIENNKITPELALSIVKSIASALDYAHGKGFIHRDIKPDNIMFREDGTPVLVDFGIARAVGSATKLTKTGMSIGTPHYMSPEQSRGKPLDGRSDIYSLGVVLYEMLTGKLPYEAEDSDSIAIAIKHIQDPIPDLRSEVRGKRLEAEAIEHLQNLINKMMAKDPDDRAQSGRELINLINNVVAGLEPARSNSPYPDVGVQNIEPHLGISKNNVGLKNTSLEKIKTGKEILSAENLDSPYNRDNKRKRTIKILVSVLSVSLIVLLLFLFLKSSKSKIDEDSWAEAMRVHSIYSFENYLRKNPDGQYSSKARWWINTLKAETEARKRKEEQNKREKELKREKERIAKMKREAKIAKAEIERLRKKEETRKDQERLAAVLLAQEKRAEEERKQKEEIKRQSETYSSRIRLRSSYCTLSTDEVKSMLKKHDFFDSSWNKVGDFHNDFRLRTINGDKAVVDRSTGLMWHQGGSSSYMNFSKAEKWIRSLNSSGYAGHYDWRLPTLEEAASILESSKSGKLYIDPVFSQSQMWIWTGDKYDSSRGWVVAFFSGYINGGYFSSFDYVRPVRMDN